MRNWMFIKQFTPIREYLLDSFDLRVLGDVDRGAFDEVPNEVLAAAMSVFQKVLPSGEISVAMQPTALDDNSYDRQRTRRKRAAVLTQVGRFEFFCDRFEVIKEKPLIYWWDEAFLKRYAETPKMGDETDVRQGMATANNTRFLRQPWEIKLTELFICPPHQPLLGLPRNKWVPYIKGAAGKVWFEPISDVLLWEPNALAVKLMDRDGKQTSRPQNEGYYFSAGVAFTSTGNSFTARCHRFRSVFDVKGQSVYPKSISSTVCLMNSQTSRNILNALNPTISFQVGDAKRFPLFPITNAEEIFGKLDAAKDPSLAVAHGCFWKYHPAKAYEWELRLQDEIAPDFTIDEENSDSLREEFEDKYPQLVGELRDKEEKRRERKRKKEDQDNDYGEIFEQQEE